MKIAGLQSLVAWRQYALRLGSGLVGKSPIRKSNAESDYQNHRDAVRTAANRAIGGLEPAAFTAIDLIMIRVESTANSPLRSLPYEF